jgi:hypothetical protein
MASIVSAGTTSATALNMSADTTGILQLASNNGTVAVTISTSQNMGIGTTSPAVRLNVTDSSDGGNSGTIRLGSDGTYYGQEQFRYNSSEYRIGVYPSGNMTFYTTGSENMRINSSGNVGIGESASIVRKLCITASGTTASTRAGIQLKNEVGTTAEIYQGPTSNNALIFEENGSERMRIDTSGRLLVGTTATFGNDGFLNVDSTAAVLNGVNVKCASVNYAYIAYTGTNFIYFTTSGGGPVGTITYNGSITVYGTTSDQRLKENIVDAPSAFDFINSLKIRSFDWKESGKHHKFGVIAQELVEVFPESVSVPQKEEDIWQVDTSALVPSLVKAIQELNAKVTALEEQVLNLGVK